MKKLLLIASLFSVGGAFGMQENEAALPVVPGAETALPMISNVQPIKHELTSLQRSGRLALSGALVGAGVCAGVGAVNVFKGKGSARLVDAATVATVVTAYLAVRPFEHDFAKCVINAEQKLTDKAVKTVLEHKKMAIAGAVVAGGLAAYYAK